ncbi:MAG: hypothetical protein V8T48_11770 [Oscillospiraceae bacterium]
MDRCRWAIIIVRTGSLIPLDGKVVSGEAMVNQSSMTGESQPGSQASGQLCLRRNCRRRGRVRHSGGEGAGQRTL